MISRLCLGAERGLGRLLVFLMGLMVVDVTWQVASRFVFRNPSSFTEEMAGFLLIWIGLLGAAYGFRTRVHPGIDLLVNHLGAEGRRMTEVLAHTLVLLFAFATMVGGGLRLVQLAFRLEQISAALGVRMGYIYLVLPLAGLLVVLFSVESIQKAWAGEKRGEGMAER